MPARITTGIYLLIIGSCIGCIFMLALADGTIQNIDVLFRGNNYTTTSITKYDQGIVLSDIIAKFANVAIVCGIIVLLYETMSYKFQKSNVFVWLLGIANTILLLLFGFMYSPKISKIFVDEPKVMAMPNAESILNQSELILELLLVTLVTSFFARIILVGKEEKKS